MNSIIVIKYIPSDSVIKYIAINTVVKFTTSKIVIKYIAWDIVNYTMTLLSSTLQVILLSKVLHKLL